MSYFSAAVAHRGDSTPWDGMIDGVAGQYGVEPALVRAVIAAESAWDPTAVSFNASSYGLMQLNIAAHGLTADYAFNPATALGYGTRLLGDQLRRLGGDLSLALAAYNAGTSRSAADLTQRIAGNVNGVGTYVRTVLDYLGYYRGVAALRTSPAAEWGAPPGAVWDTPTALDEWGAYAELGGDGGAGSVLETTPGPGMPSWGLLAALGAGILAVVLVAD